MNAIAANKLSFSAVSSNGAWGSSVEFKKTPECSKQMLCAPAGHTSEFQNLQVPDQNTAVLSSEQAQLSSKSEYATSNLYSA